MTTKTRAKTTARAKKVPTPKAPARKTAAKPRTTTTKAAKPRKTALTTIKAAPVTNGPRRTVFIDVENTSSESELARVLDELNIDLTSGTTEVTAIGNWRVVGQQLGRSLAQRGAHLVHSAPATRVPDWSDLWIAVQAGIWLGRSRPGDLIDIVSHDRAFDAVGDAAARLGVTFTRITYRSAGASAAASERASAAASERAGEPGGERPRRRRRRRGGSGRSSAGSGGSATASRAAHVASAPRMAAHAAPAPRMAAVLADDEPQAAPQQQLQQVIARLAAADPAHTVTLDALTVALKAAGFQRPAGSPRLVTRLRRMKDIEVLPNGRVRMNPNADTAALPTAAEPLAEPAAATDEGDLDDGGGEDGDADDGGTEAGAVETATGEGAVKRRSRRRGGRRRGGRGRKTAGAAPAPPAE